MKLVIAYIQPHKLTEVKDALAAAGVGKMSVTNALGCGQQMGYEENYRGVKVSVNLLKKIRLEIALNDEFLATTIGTIMETAGTNTIGDGKIFVLDLAECYRIRTRDQGKKAIG
ncbi:P-II family nitrogen regulator [candidate division FCPU426 bacterium]|nr:P-II family nitrogen regulator [candidate division FCPU426 bacterium]